MSAEQQQRHTQPFATCYCTERRLSASCRTSVVKHLPVAKCWQQERQTRAGISYQVSYHHYEYEYYQCLACLRLILWFSAAEELSGMLGFLTRQLVCTKTCLIFTSMEMFDFWSWTKRVYWRLMFHWTREELQILSPNQASGNASSETLWGQNKCLLGFQTAGAETIQTVASLYIWHIWSFIFFFLADLPYQT